MSDTIAFKNIPVLVPANTPISISSGFGSRDRPTTGASTYHRGVDIAVPTGTPIVSVDDGVVLDVFPITSDCGLGVKIEHYTTTTNTVNVGGRGTTATQKIPLYVTTYCHMSSVKVSKNDRVTAQQIIGAVGSTGTATGPHLHFAVRVYNGNQLTPINPQPLLESAAPQTTFVPSSTQGSPIDTTGTPISPYIETLESLHPNIQYELTRRRQSAETANTYMPFVRLTSLTNVLEKNLIQQYRDPQQQSLENQLKAYCPTLGIHGQPEVSYDDIYYPNNSNKSIVGYATAEDANNKIIRVPVVVEDGVEDQQNIPIPGITNIQTDRSTAGPFGVRGGLFRATINIRAYSVGQINTLLRYFLRPATRVVLELGRTSSSDYENTIAGELNKTETQANEFFQKFKWDRPKQEIDSELEPLVRAKKGQKEFIEKYIFNNFGNYEIYIGYVVTFKLKYTKENFYDIELTVHSIQQYEVPTKNSGVHSDETMAVPNTCKTVEISDYFTNTSAWRPNSFSNLMAQVFAPDTRLSAWQSDVVQLNSPGTDGTTQSPGYLVTWQFFVDVILNDTEYGLLGIYQLENSTDTIKFVKNSVIKEIGNLGELDETSLNSNEVSWHPDLRSTNPNTMIIVNKGTELPLTRILTAADDNKRKNLENELNNSTVFSKLQSYKNFTENSPGSGTSVLTNGVWLNTNMIVNAFTTADTITMALSKILTEMNNATQGFWNLQLLSNDTNNPGIHVIDMGLSKPVDSKPRPMEEDLLITNAINNFRENLNKFTDEKGKPYLYLFNRKLKTLSINDIEGDVGSELLDIALDSTLPQVIAVQAIAGVGGIADAGTLNAIDIDELRQIGFYNVYPREAAVNDICEGDKLIKIPGIQNMEPDDITYFANLLLNQSYYVEEQNKPSLERALEEFKQKTLENWKVRNLNLTETDFRSIQTKIQEYVDDQRERIIPGFTAITTGYSTLYGKALQYVEFNLSKMISLLTKDKEKSKVHPFNSSNLTKTIVDLTLPGIGGIQLFQSFSVDRIPNILTKGYYVVTKIVHEFSLDRGWITKVQGRFRYKPDEESTSDVRRQQIEQPQSVTTLANTQTEQSRSNNRGFSSQIYSNGELAPTELESFARRPALQQPEVRQLPTADYSIWSEENLVSRYKKLVNRTTEPGLFTLWDTKENWRDRLNSGAVARDRADLERVTAEIRRRLDAYYKNNKPVSEIFKQQLPGSFFVPYLYD